MEPGEPQRRQINLADQAVEITARLREDEFWALRGKAIHAYAQVEQSLCEVFVETPGQSNQAAAAAARLFFEGKTTAHMHRIRTLICSKYGNQYDTFWTSIFREIEKDILPTRHKIVHWLTVARAPITIHGLTEAEHVLRHPTFWYDVNGPTDDIRKQDLINFGRKCEFYANMIHSFSLVVQHKSFAPPLDPDAAKEWENIFRQVLIYPPPEGFNLPQRVYKSI